MLDEQAAQAKAESQAKQRAEAEKAEKQKETSLVQDTISKNNDFAVCRICSFTFTKYESWNECNGSSNPSHDPCIPCVDALSMAGYVRSQKVGYLVAGEIVSHSRRWVPTPKAEQVIGKGLIEQSEIPYSGYQPIYHVAHEYRWNVLLGCREVQQIDATTQLSDGLKVDFSWHWRTTDIGDGYGLSDKRQRGVAYLTRTASGLVIDQIKME
jgi:hypothetical protein